MRAHEFVTETRKAFAKTGRRMHKNTERSLPSAHRVAGTADRHYDLGRILSQVAAEDGTGRTEFPVERESWAGRNNTAHPYTEIESRMLQKAYEKQGISWQDVLKPNPHQRSLEPKDTNVKSPIAKPFSEW